MRIALGECKICGRKSPLISSYIGICLECIRSNPDAPNYAISAHKIARSGLPLDPPRGEGLRCSVCDAECIIPEGGVGYCGLVSNKNGKLVNLAGAPFQGLLEYYYDPIPTNCVNYWFCPASTGLGYPKWALRNGPESGYYNLAVFYGACNLNCLFCQNWFFRDLLKAKKPIVSAETLLRAASKRVTCICFFGGDPSPQVSNALFVARRAIEIFKDRIMRICWETNGHFNPRIMRAVMDTSMKSGGIVKFDLKAWNSRLYKVLTGRDLGVVYQNAREALLLSRERPEVPLFSASTLLVPGYVDEEEVRMIARFIASINPDAPYSLLAFHPSFLMSDLPNTSRRHAMDAMKAAREEGLTKIHIGNPWLLTRMDYDL
ncbi:MAG: radical SAM protein [Candidatus Methanodesulfokora sp.]